MNSRVSEFNRVDNCIVPPNTCLIANGICAFEATKASYYAATRTLQTRRAGGTSIEIALLEEEAAAEEIVIPESIEELPESMVEEEIPSVPLTETEELLIPEEVTPSEEITPLEEIAPREEAFVLPPVERLPEQSLASLLLASLGVIRESVWMSITVILCFAGLAVIGIREWELARKKKKKIG